MYLPQHHTCNLSEANQIKLILLYNKGHWLGQIIFSGRQFQIQGYISISYPRLCFLGNIIYISRESEYFVMGEIKEEKTNIFSVAY